MIFFYYNLNNSYILQMSSLHNKLPVIHFNSKSSDKDHRALLSNFYGGVEFEYISQRYSEPVIHLLDRMKVADFKTFLGYLKQLQPDKKTWTVRQEQYWTRNGEPIHGILAKLVGNGVRDPKRLKTLQDMVQEVKIKEDVPDTQKILQMASCLQHKFALHELYRNVLLNTGDAILHEKPLRGNGGENNWTYKKLNGVEYGYDWLGQLLMWIRTDIRYKSPPLQDFIKLLVENKCLKLQHQLKELQQKNEKSKKDIKIIEYIEKELQLCF